MHINDKMTISITHLAFIILGYHLIPFILLKFSCFGP